MAFFCSLKILVMLELDVQDIRQDSKLGGSEPKQSTMILVLAK
jgi:hypothetical protein